MGVANRGERRLQGRPDYRCRKKREFTMPGGGAAFRHFPLHRLPIIARSFSGAGHPTTFRSVMAAPGQLANLFSVTLRDAGQMARIDSKDEKLTALVEVGEIPHPGRGANFVDPQFGPVRATSHLGDASIAVTGTVPEGHQDQAWKVVRTLQGQGAGPSSWRPSRIPSNSPSIPP
jgi:hypothetical protein